MFSPGLCSAFLTWRTRSQDPFGGLAATSEGTRGGRTSPTQTRASGRLNGRALCLDLRLEHAHFLVHLHILQLALQNPQLPLGLLWPRWGEDAGRHHLLRVPSQAASPTGTAHATAAAAVAAAAATSATAATIQPAPAAAPAPRTPGLLQGQRLCWGEEKGSASPRAEDAAGTQRGPPGGLGRLAAAGPGAATLELVGAVHDHQAIEGIAVHSHSTGSARRRGSPSRSTAGASSSRGSRLSPGGPAAVALRADGAAWPRRRAQGKIAGSAPAPSSINDFAAAIAQTSRSRAGDMPRGLRARTDQVA